MVDVGWVVRAANRGGKSTRARPQPLPYLMRWEFDREVGRFSAQFSTDSHSTAEFPQSRRTTLGSRLASITDYYQKRPHRNEQGLSAMFLRLSQYRTNREETMDDQQFNRLHQLLTKISNQLDDLIAIEKKSEDALDTIKWK